MDRNKKAIENLQAKKRKKIVIYGAPCHLTTGNSKLVRFMAKAFQSAGHEVFNIGIDYNRPQIWYDGIPVMPSFFCETCGNSNKGSEESVQKLVEYMTLLNPEFFIAVGDPYQMQQFGLGRLNLAKSKIKALMYCTLDSEGVFCDENQKLAGRPSYIDICDRVISTSVFTQEQLKKHLLCESEMIHETIDLNNYSSISEDKKKELRKKYRFAEDAFIMYSGGRNIMRKRLFTLLDGAAKFICETENTFLYLNIPVETSNSGQAYFPDVLNPQDFIKRVLKQKYGRDLMSEGRMVFIQRGGLGHLEISESQNAELYQISDVYVTAGGAEGFGLMQCESLACGVPAVVPQSTTGKEIIGVSENDAKSTAFSYGKGGLLTKCPTEHWEAYGLKQDLTTPDNTYEAIKELHDNPELRRTLAKDGKAYVKEMFNTEKFTNKWIDIINTTEKKVVEKADEGFKKMELGEKKNGK